MKSTFKVLFYLKKGSEKKNGEVMIMARITIDGKLCQFSTKQSIQPENWNVIAGKAKGRDTGRINSLLDDIRASLNTIYHEMQRRDNYVTAEKVKNGFWGHSENHETILTLFQKAQRGRETACGYIQDDSHLPQVRGNTPPPCGRLHRMATDMYEVRSVMATCAFNNISI